MRTQLGRVAGLVCLLVSLGVGAAGTEITPLETTLVSRGFEPIGKRDGVSVFKHPISSIVRTAGEGVFDAPPDKVLKVLVDYKKQQGRVGRVSEVEILESGTRRILVYQRLNLPVISDRDYNALVDWGEDGGIQWVTYTAVTDRGRPPQKGVVRVSKHSGSWQLRPVEGGKKTFARFQVSLDVAGLVPLWLVRPGTAKEIPRLFREIGEIIKDEK